MKDKRCPSCKLLMMIESGLSGVVKYKCDNCDITLVKGEDFD